MTRLDKLLTQSGLYSRSEARELIRSGRVSVDGETLRRPEVKAAEDAAVFVDGEEVNCSLCRYFMLNKPAGVLSATDDRSQPTVLDLLPREIRALGLFPVGRLDKDTTGLLLLTNDGDFAHRVISPKHGVVKTYLAVTASPVDAEDVRAFREGITLADGTHCLPAVLEPLDGCRCRVLVSEGKYHQVKRMLAACGKPCTALERTAVGALELDPELPRGGWRELRQFETGLVFGSSQDNQGADLCHFTSEI